METFRRNRNQQKGKKITLEISKLVLTIRIMAGAMNTANLGTLQVNTLKVEEDISKEK